MLNRFGSGGLKFGGGEKLGFVGESTVGSEISVDALIRIPTLGIFRPEIGRREGTVANCRAPAMASRRGPRR